MRECTTKGFVKRIEELLPRLFNCERCVVALVHRRKKFLFRISFDSESNCDQINQYEMTTGYSGIVAVSGKTLHSSRVIDDVNFIPEIDDP
jgi:transcription elongation factor Elf1